MVLYGSVLFVERITLKEYNSILYSMNMECIVVKGVQIRTQENATDDVWLR